MTVLYGSSVADTTLTTACLMATASGGTETSKQTAYGGGSGNFGEVWSKGNASAVCVTALPAPTGNGWIYYPGAGTFAAGNWTLVITYAVFANNGDTQSFRIYKRSGGVYTAIGTITFPDTNVAKTTYSPAAVSMPATTFAAGDGLYFDLWYKSSFGAVGDNATVYESTTSTAGVANDLQITTSTWTPAASGNAIVGRARSKYTESIASKGQERAKFLLSKAQVAAIRDTFKLSIGSKQSAQSKFIVSKAVIGRSRSIFVVSIKELARGRSRFYSAAVSKGQARSSFLEAIIQKSGARSKFLLSIGQKGVSRAKYLISKAYKGLARAKFAEAIAQRGQARSKFSLSAIIKGLAESTFKIAISGGHAITSYMRSRYKVSIRQTQAQRSKYRIRFAQAAQVRSRFFEAARSSAQARSRFLIAFKLANLSRSRFFLSIRQTARVRSHYLLSIAQAAVARSRYLIRFSQAVRSRVRFLIRFGLVGIARSRYALAIRQATQARSHFITRLALVVRARSKFLIQGILVTYPIKSITHAVSQVLSAAWNVLEALGLVSSHASALTVTHQELAMPAPYTTILPTITVTDISGAPVSNASAVSLVVYFPDSTTSNLSLGSGITNLGNGQYQARYNTKQPGEIREVWSIVGADGTTLASAQFLVGVEY